MKYLYIEEREEGRNMELKDTHTTKPVSIGCSLIHRAKIMNIPFVQGAIHTLIIVPNPFP